MRKIILLLLLSSCAEDLIQDPKEQEHTFFVYAIDGKEFAAAIEWGINGIQERERVTSSGFGSSVELRQSDELVLQVDASGLAVRVTNNKTGAGSVTFLLPGQFTVIKPR